MTQKLLKPASSDDWIQLLKAWRIWLLAAMLGALIGYIAFVLIPPAFRAQASVNVNLNLEKAWPDANSERLLMTYLARETNKLVAVAWDDQTLTQVVDQVPGTSLESLRSGVLQLSQPGDGIWHFWADSQDAALAQKMAGSWAQAFYQRALQGVDTANQLLADQAALQQSPASASLLAEVARLEKDSLAINPYIQLSLVQGESLPVSRSVSPGIFMLAGCLVAWSATLISLFIAGRKPEKI